MLVIHGVTHNTLSYSRSMTITLWWIMRPYTTDSGVPLVLIISRISDFDCPSVHLRLGRGHTENTEHFSAVWGRFNPRRFWDSLTWWNAMFVFSDLSPLTKKAKAEFPNLWHRSHTYRRCRWNERPSTPRHSPQPIRKNTRHMSICIVLYYTDLLQEDEGFMYMTITTLISR